MDECISDWWRYNCEVWLTGIVAIQKEARWWSKVGCMSICHSKDGQTLMNRIFRMLPWWLESDSKYLYNLYNHIGLSKPFLCNLCWPTFRFQPISAFQPRRRQMRKEKQALAGNGRRWRQRQHRRSANTNQITPPHQLRELAWTYTVIYNIYIYMFIRLYYITLHYIMLYDIILYYIILYYIIFICIYGVSVSFIMNSHIWMIKTSSHSMESW